MFMYACSAAPLFALLNDGIHTKYYYNEKPWDAI